MTEMESLEEQSLLNLINYYENDLRRIFNGASVNDVLENGDRRILRDKYIINHRNRKWTLSEKAREILSQPT
jgi:hypothetical protein